MKKMAEYYDEFGQQLSIILISFSIDGNINHARHVPKPGLAYAAKNGFATDVAIARLG